MHIPALVFNVFVFAQVFNEFNARILFDDWNVFAGDQMSYKTY